MFGLSLLSSQTLSLVSRYIGAGTERSSSEYVARDREYMPQASSASLDRRFPKLEYISFRIICTIANFTHA
jgi:hypothetical protein